MDERFLYSRVILAKYILVDESQRKKLSDHAKNYLPNESCAILLGITNGEKITLKKSVIVENADASPVEFSIKPDQLFSTYANAEKDGLEVIGIFHSHPTSRFRVWISLTRQNQPFMAIDKSLEYGSFTPSLMMNLQHTA